MTFVVPTQRGAFEIRESRTTPDGPRSRTLASFRELTDEVIERAQGRTTGQTPSAEELRSAALRAGAPVAGAAVDEAARETLRLAANGQQLDPMLKRLLQDALEREGRADRPADPDALVSDNARSATEWIGASPKERSKVLRDLLELADALPVRLRPTKIGFPRLRSV
jgi:hypothetical protein